MATLKDRLTATEQRLKELKESRKAADKARRQAHKQSRANRDRKVMLVGEAVLRRVERGEWDEADFRQIPGASASERVLYRLTGQQLPALKTDEIAPSFDALLVAWGIARVPPQLSGEVSTRVVLTD